MRCLNCEYELHDIAARVCPECGRAFDRDNPETFARTGVAFNQEKWAWRLLWVLAFSPIYAALMTGALWLTAYAILGRAPRPNLDDPKGIPFVRHVVGPTVWLVVLSEITGLLLTFLFAIASWPTPNTRSLATHRFRLLLLAAVTSTALFWAAGLLVPQFGGAIGWMLD